MHERTVWYNGAEYQIYRIKDAATNKIHHYEVDITQDFNGYIIYK
jgi:hypothetical protein